MTKTTNSKLRQDSNGKYNWYYELNLFKKPTALITVFKVFGGIVLGCGLLLGLLFMCMGNGFGKSVQFMISFWLIGFAFIVVLGGMGYCIYAGIQGGKYCVEFEMDKKSVTHTQHAKQFKKAQGLATVLQIMGVLTGSSRMVGSGILVGGHNSVVTKFKQVNKIKVKRRRNVIYLHAYEWNQIYVEKEDFDIVLENIIKYIPDSAKRIGL